MGHKFGAGVATAIPQIDLSGITVTNPTPVPFGVLQEFSVDFSGSIKELFGQYRLPVAAAPGTMKVTCKAKAAKFTAALFNSVFGETPATGERKLSFEEDGTTDKSTYLITVAQHTAFLYDLGVKYGANGAVTDGRALTRGATASAAGIYSLDPLTGIYTFHTSEGSLKMKISYLYSTVAAPGQNFTINNQLLGTAPIFSVVWNGRYAGKQGTIELVQCTTNKLTLATKLEDWTIPEFDFSAFCNDAGVLAKWSEAE